MAIERCVGKARCNTLASTDSSSTLILGLQRVFICQVREWVTGLIKYEPSKMSSRMSATGLEEVTGHRNNRVVLPWEVGLHSCSLQCERDVDYLPIGQTCRALKPLGDPPRLRGS